MAIVESVPAGSKPTCGQPSDADGLACAPGRLDIVWMFLGDSSAPVDRYSISTRSEHDYLLAGFALGRPLGTREQPGGDRFARSVRNNRDRAWHVVDPTARVDDVDAVGHGPCTAADFSSRCSHDVTRHRLDRIREDPTSISEDELFGGPLCVGPCSALRSPRSS